MTEENIDELSTMMFGFKQVEGEDYLIDQFDGKHWFVEGERHREGAPAVEHADGGKEWWNHNDLHRLDGAAYERSDGYKEYYLFNEQVHPEEIVDLWLERGVFCWYDEANDCLNFGE